VEGSGREGCVEAEGEGRGRGQQRDLGVGGVKGVGEGVGEGGGEEIRGKKKDNLRRGR